jgi:hypothetical protein
MGGRMNKAGPFALTRLALSLVVVLTLAGACASTSPLVAGPTEVALASPTEALATVAPTPTLPGVTTTDTPGPTDSAQSPTPTPTYALWLPPGSPLPPTTLPDPTPTPPPPTDPPSTRPPTGGGTVKTGNSPPTRVVVPGLGIDLPVMKGNSSYPYCNVAQYMTNFVNPGQPGTTYMYGHARTGMFLPFLTHSKNNDGAAMIGLRVELYTADKKLHVYRINIVKRHVRDFSLATDLAKGQHRLIMQTSEGPSGLYPKLQIAARPIAVYESTAAEAFPTPHPRRC